MDTVMEIKVLNKNNVLIADMYDGYAYKFEPNVPIKLPLAAARNIFGVDFPDTVAECQSEEFRHKIWENLQRRWGWNTYDEVKYKIARNMFKNIILTPVVMQLVEKEAVEITVADPRPEKEAPKAAKPGKYASDPEEKEVA